MVTVDEAFSIVDKHLRSSDAQHNAQKSNKMITLKERELCFNNSNSINVPEDPTLCKLQGVRQSDNFDHILPAFRTSWRDGPCPFHSYRGEAQCTTQQIVDDLIDTEIVYKNITDEGSEQCQHNKSREQELTEVRRAWKDHKLLCTLVPSTFHTVVEPTKIVVTDCDDGLRFNEKHDSESSPKASDEHSYNDHPDNGIHWCINEPSSTFIATTNPQRDRAELQKTINTNKLKSEWSLPSHRRALLEQHCVRHYPFGAFGLKETPLISNTSKVCREHEEQLRRLCNRQRRQLRNSDFTPPDHVFGPICTRSSPLVRGRLFNAPNDHLLGAFLL